MRGAEWTLLFVSTKSFKREQVKSACYHQQDCICVPVTIDCMLGDGWGCSCEFIDVRRTQFFFIIVSLCTLVFFFIRLRVHTCSFRDPPPILIILLSNMVTKQLDIGHIVRQAVGTLTTPHRKPIGQIMPALRAYVAGRPLSMSVTLGHEQMNAGEAIGLTEQRFRAIITRYCITQAAKHNYNCDTPNWASPVIHAFVELFPKVMTRGRVGSTSPDFQAYAMLTSDISGLLSGTVNSARNATAGKATLEVETRLTISSDGLHVSSLPATESSKSIWTRLVHSFHTSRSEKSLSNGLSVNFERIRDVSYVTKCRLRYSCSCCFGTPIADGTPDCQHCHIQPECCRKTKGIVTNYNTGRGGMVALQAAMEVQEEAPDSSDVTRTRTKDRVEVQVRLPGDRGFLCVHISRILYPTEAFSVEVECTVGQSPAGAVFLLAHQAIEVAVVMSQLTRLLRVAFSMDVGDVNKMKRKFPL